MASGQVSLVTKSVDYPGPPYGRGACVLTNVIGWTVDDNDNISFNLISSTDNVGGSWFVCYSSAPYYIELVPQVSYNNGSSWTSLDTKRHLVNTQCGSGQTNTISMSSTLINSLGSYHLTGNCKLRFLYYITVEPRPDAGFPNAFPSSSYSEATQVPVDIDVSWTARVKYNANGGTGAPSDSTKTVAGSSSSTTITLKTGKPTRTNYRFEGWANSSSATTPNYQPGGSVTVQKSSPTKTIYAVWEEYYRPGAILNSSNAWKTHNRTSGAASICTGSNWKEMRTIKGPTETNDPPLMRHSSGNKNMRKIGAN